MRLVSPCLCLVFLVFGYSVANTRHTHARTHSGNTDCLSSPRHREAFLPKSPKGSRNAATRYIALVTPLLFTSCRFMSYSEASPHRYYCCVSHRLALSFPLLRHAAAALFCHSSRGMSHPVLHFRYSCPIWCRRLPLP